MADYIKQEWKDGEDGATPINANALNHMEDGIKTAFEQISSIFQKIEDVISFCVKPCDITNEIYKLKPAVGETVEWEAEEDCWVLVYFKDCGNKGTGYKSTISVGGKEVFKTEYISYNSYAGAYNSMLLPMFYVRAGSLISLTRSQYINDEAYCTMYGCYEE